MTEMFSISTVQYDTHDYWALEIWLVLRNWIFNVYILNQFKFKQPHIASGTTLEYGN